MFTFPLIGVLLIHLLGAKVEALGEVGPVLTTSGIVQGHPASWPNGTTVVEFLGIPYAQSPVGELRFAAPRRFQTNSSVVFLADKYVRKLLNRVQRVC